MQTELFAFGTQQMHSETDSEGWRSRLYFFDEGFGQSKLSQIPHAVTKGANAGKDQLLRCANVVRIRSDPHIMAEPAQCVFQAAEVIQFVVDNRNHDVTHSPPRRGGREARAR